MSNLTNAEQQIKESFKYLNTYKRFRALHDTAVGKGRVEEAESLELKMYKSIDALELSMRGLQTEIKRQAGAHNDSD